MDFPAAHSMDTDWYAVDRDGRVARCSSGEVGPVPDDAFRSDWTELYMELVVVRIALARDATADDATENELVRQIVDGDAAAHEIYADHREARGLAAGWTPHARGIYTVGRSDIVLTAAAAVTDYLEGIFVFASEEDAAASGWKQVDARYALPHARFGCVDRKTFETLWEASTLEQVFFVSDVPDPHELGLFQFHHDWGYGPYARDAVPAKPIVLADLPAPLREQIEALRLRAVTFTAESLDPEAHVPCYRWGS